jgi:hypothetical protein
MWVTYREGNPQRWREDYVASTGYSNEVAAFALVARNFPGIQVPEIMFQGKVFLSMRELIVG